MSLVVYGRIFFFSDIMLNCGLAYGTLYIGVSFTPLSTPAKINSMWSMNFVFDGLYHIVTKY
jgi:uncharacterized membrane protein